MIYLIDCYTVVVVIETWVPGGGGAGTCNEGIVPVCPFLTFFDPECKDEFSWQRVVVFSVS